MLINAEQVHSLVAVSIPVDSQSHPVLLLVHHRAMKSLSLFLAILPFSHTLPSTLFSRDDDAAIPEINDVDAIPPSFTVNWEPNGQAALQPFPVLHTMLQGLSTYAVRAFTSLVPNLMFTQNQVTIAVTRLGAVNIQNNHAMWGLLKCAEKMASDENSPYAPGKCTFSLEGTDVGKVEIRQARANENGQVDLDAVKPAEQDTSLTSRAEEQPSTDQTSDELAVVFNTDNAEIKATLFPSGFALGIKAFAFTLASSMTLLAEKYPDPEHRDWPRHLGFSTVIDSENTRFRMVPPWDIEHPDYQTAIRAITTVWFAMHSFAARREWLETTFEVYKVGEAGGARTQLFSGFLKVVQPRAA